MEVPSRARPGSGYRNCVVQCIRNPQLNQAASGWSASRSWSRPAAMPLARLSASLGDYTSFASVAELSSSPASTMRIYDDSGQRRVSLRRSNSPRVRFGLNRSSRPRSCSEDEHERLRRAPGSGVAAGAVWPCDGLVTVTVAFATLGVWLGRNSGGATWFISRLASIACLFGPVPPLRLLCQRTRPKPESGLVSQPVCSLTTSCNSSSGASSRV